MHEPSVQCSRNTYNLPELINKPLKTLKLLINTKH